MRKIIAALIALMIAVGVWWYASPLWTLRQMREAAEQGDARKLSRYVDYPAVREDLKAEFRRAMMAEMIKGESNGFEALGSAFALAMIDPMIDAIVTPEGVEAMFSQERRAKAAAKKGPQLPEASGNPIIDREGFDRFVVRDKDPTKGSLIFERSGAGWKLSGLDMPPSNPTDR
jgi:hypothetical protein